MNSSSGPFASDLVATSCRIMLEGDDDHAVLPASLRQKLRGPAYQGYVDERSTCHVAGWVRELNNQAARVMVERVRIGADNATTLVTVQANRHSRILEALGVGDACHAFYAAFDPALSPAQRDQLVARPVGGTQALELAPALATSFDRASPVLRAIGI